MSDLTKKKLAEETKRCEDLANTLINWFSVDEHYSIIHFASEQGISRKELFDLANKNATLAQALNYGLTVQEYKLSDGALNGAIKEKIALEMLRTFNDWAVDKKNIETKIAEQHIHLTTVNIKQMTTEEIARRITEGAFD